MRTIIHFNISKGDKYYIGECSELPIITQGKTLDETVANIKEAFSLYIEEENLEDLDISPAPVISINLDVCELDYA